jgi:hypothetical protein
VSAVDAGAGGDRFALAREVFESVTVWLDGDDAARLTHGELEEQLDEHGRALLRRLYQDHLDLRAQREVRGEPRDAAGVVRRAVECGHTRVLGTVFGKVTVQRYAYRKRGHGNLYPADEALNLPAGMYSHGIARVVAVEAARGSFADAVSALERACGQKVGKRQVEALVYDAAADFEAFYAGRRPARNHTAVLAISADGKGIVIRPDALRAGTAKAAEAGAGKLATRLSRGEKPNRKRMAEVGAVFDVIPAPRTPAEVIARTREKTVPGPRIEGKWLTASVTRDAATVIADLFTEAHRRDPRHRRTWIALVDGNTHQINRIRAEAEALGVTVTIIVDFIHVLEYLWKAAWCFFPEADPAAESWVAAQAEIVLDGGARRVATTIRARTTRQHLPEAKAAQARTAAAYLTTKAPYLHYNTALRKGWPIATGVIEGACRHLIKDRMDVTGARWGLDGAEAVLKLRAIYANDDFEDYWHFHLEQEHDRNHTSRYTQTITIP